MRIVGVAFACWILAGCTVKTGYTSPDPNPPTVRRLREPEPVVHHRREPKAGPELVAANAPRTKRADARTEQQEAMCAATREKRNEDRAAWHEWLQRKAAFEAWSAEHCVQIDHGKDELQTLINHRGEISQRIVTIGDIETKCDAKAPDTLKAIRGSKPEYDMSADYRCGDTLRQQAERAAAERTSEEVATSPKSP